VTANGFASITRHFADLEDPRVERTKVHPLVNVLTIGLCAVICGARHFTEMEEFGESRKEWLSQFLDLTNGIPSHDTFNGVFARLKPAEFERCLVSWITALHEVTEGQILPIDGKTLRGSYDRADGKAAIPMVSVWATQNHLSLGSVVVDEKSSEITAIPRLWELIDISGALVTIDAMGCQKEMAGKILDEEGDYVLAVKENQPHLDEDIERAFDEALDQGEPGVDFTECQTEGPRKGRQETRTCCVITNPKGIRDAGLWTGLTAIVMVISERVVNGVAGSETRYFIGSVARTAEEYLRWVRGHWGIENSLHWVLDVCFCEDDQRHWAGNSAENLGWLRKLALCLLKAEKSRSSKGKSINTRRLIAGWKNDYLLTVLAQIPEKSGA
jgi:predicted transposase YbfD/YdcC